jgi:hypothetical protein
MIKTTTAVPYDLVNPSLTSIVFAKITSTNRNDNAETYTLNILEWVEIPYSMEVPDGNGGVVLENFVDRKNIRTHTRVMTFADSDALTGGLDQMYTITETGAFRRKKYTELGHLLINNLEVVRGAQWELV